MVDVKVLIDPAALNSGNKEVRTLEQQVTNIVNSIKFQQERVKTDFNETVFHVINLFRIRPSERDLVRAIFEVKAIQEGVNIDLNCVLFLNTSDDSIYQAIN